MTLTRKTPLRKSSFKRSAFKPKGTASIERLLGEGKITRASQLKAKKPMKKRRKPTGELKLFKRLYEERGGVSQISGIPLLPPDHETFVAQFSHVCGKGAYPEFRLLEENIVLKTVHEHTLWGERRWELRDRTEWAWVFELEAKLKRMAHGV